MAWLGLVVPQDVGHLFEGVKIPGQREKASDMHVTVLYMGEVPMKEVAKAMLAAVAVTQSQRPFLCTCNEISSFPNNGDGVPIISPVASSPLVALHEKLKAAFDAAGVPYSKKYPEFKPHVTLAYDHDAEAEPFQAPLPGLCAWVANELVIWGGENGNKVSIHLPFILAPGFLGVAAARIASSPPFRP
jgi:2'-5' RNA ligase